LLLSMSAAAVAAAAAAARPNLRVMQQVSLSNAGRVICALTVVRTDVVINIIDY